MYVYWVRIEVTHRGMMVRNNKSLYNFSGLKLDQSTTEIKNRANNTVDGGRRELILEIELGLARLRRDKR